MMPVGGAGGVLRVATGDIKISGYHISKGTLVNFNLFNIMHDVERYIMYLNVNVYVIVLTCVT